MSVFSCLSSRSKISSSYRLNKHLLKNENHPMDILHSSKSNVLGQQKVFLLSTLLLVLLLLFLYVSPKSTLTAWI